MELKRKGFETSNFTQFKEDYKNCKVCKDLDNAIINNLNLSAVIKMKQALELTKKTTGIDARQDFLIGILKNIIYYYDNK